ncbi:MAG: VWA domain-containing protein [Phycisphaerales bacterium]|nr:VWA domain-containing protein [Phycisphaerales bacterium]
MPNVEFDNFAYLNLAWVALGVAGVAVLGVILRRRGVRAFVSAGLLPRLTREQSWFAAISRVLLVSVAMALLVVAIMNPRWGEAEREVVTRGIDMMVLLDVSKSMLARDVPPSRLEAARLSLRDDLLPAMGGDRIGLITFAGLATEKCPLTSDYGFVRLVLDDISTESVPRGGTRIGDAIRKAIDGFDDKLDTYKMILLITDGEDQDTFPVDAAREAWDKYTIPIVAVALGDEREGARIPMPSAQGERYMEHDGQIVWSKANFDQLRQIAGVSGLGATVSTFIPVGSKVFDLGAIYRRIVPGLRAVERSEKQKVERPSHYHWFALGALVLLAIDSFLRDGPPALAAGRGRAQQRQAA